MNILFYASIQSVHSFCSLFLILFLIRTMGTASREIPEIHWIYPILGLPQALYPKCPPGRYILESGNTRIQRDRS